MKKITATELKNNIGKYLDLAISGEEILINRYNRTVARLVGDSEFIASQKIEEDVQDNQNI